MGLVVNLISVVPLRHVPGSLFSGLVQVLSSGPSILVVTVVTAEWRLLVSCVEGRALLIFLFLAVIVSV